MLALPPHNPSPLREIGKEYFKVLLSQVHPSMKYGDEFHFGIQFYGADGNVHHRIVETIHKSELE